MTETPRHRTEDSRPAPSRGGADIRRRLRDLRGDPDRPSADAADAPARPDEDRQPTSAGVVEEAGRIALVPLDAIRSSKLVRDRADTEDMDLRHLVRSIREIGLSNPIQLEDAGDGFYELIQGFRRLSAHRELARTDPAFARIPASIAPVRDGIPTLYRRMVDENLVRKNISFAEMASLARDYAIDPATGAPGVEEAIRVLYASSSAQKRSYIRAFCELLDRLDKWLNWPEEIPRSLGLKLRNRMAQVEGTSGAIAQTLKGMPHRSVREELDVLRHYAQDAGEEVPLFAPEQDRMSQPERGEGGRIVVDFQHPDGRARITATGRKFELKLNHDFCRYDAASLERAGRDLMRQLAETLVERKGL
ncbi:ParB/RepB/Spo0J family partition protein [Roseobacter sp. HKCCA0434]|uniref:ParB/RepB/Spo0J family partition protein n=1 Tax=Roseobacter sp. HKCCA0434 TaxID=3079297 RepID=UPI00290599DE|nr:ParB N-terminal domain-containing protein [Roseobacter sp. HKCCA0434]